MLISIPQSHFTPRLISAKRDYVNSPINLFSSWRNFARRAEFFLVLLTLVLHESAQTMKSPAPRA